MVVWLLTTGPLLAVVIMLSTPALVGDVYMLVILSSGGKAGTNVGWGHF